MMFKTIEEIRSDLVNLTNDIKGMDSEGKMAAIKHMKETISLLKLGTNLETYDTEFKEELQEYVEYDVESNSALVKTDLKDETPGYVNGLSQAGVKEDYIELLANDSKRELLLDTTDESYGNDTLVEEASDNTKAEASSNQKPDIDISNEVVNDLSTFNQSNVKIYECSECPKKFRNRGTFWRHKNIHTDRYKCSSCHHRFETSLNLQKHECQRIIKIRKAKAEQVVLQQQSHDGDECKENVDKVITSITADENICDKLLEETSIIQTVRGKTTDSKNKSDEINVLTTDGMFKCKECPKKFSKQTTLKTHTVIHTDRYKCSNCQQRFYTNENLQNHDCQRVIKRRKVKVGVEISEPTIQHDLDQQNEEKVVNIFPSSSDEFYNAHGSSLKSDFSDIKEFTESDKIRTDDSKNIETMIEVENNKLSIDPFGCDECPKRYTTENSLKSHRILHTDKFKCHTCQQRFQRNNDLKNHSCEKTVKRRKVTELPFECNRCPKKYSNSSALINHRNEHTDRFKCEDCNKRFQSSYQLKRHAKALQHYSSGSNVRRDDVEVKYEELEDYVLISCGICEKFFATEESLKKHIKDTLCQTPNSVIVN